MLSHSEWDHVVWHHCHAHINAAFSLHCDALSCQNDLAKSLWIARKWQACWWGGGGHMGDGECVRRGRHPVNINRPLTRLSTHFKYFPLCSEIIPQIQYPYCSYSFRQFVGDLSKKSGYFTVRLTVSVYPPPLTVSFLWIFFVVLLASYYDYMCSDTDFA